VTGVFELAKRECLASGIELSEMMARYRDADRFMALCRECLNYGANWACPPFDFDVDHFLSRYVYAHVCGVKIIYSDEEIRSVDSDETSRAYSGKIFKETHAILLRLMQTLEGKFSGVGVMAGGCSVCPSCSRKEREECRFPGSAHPSLESLGFDVSEISADLLGVRLLWAKDSLPEYQAMVNAFFTTGENPAIEREIREYLEEWCSCPA
jgi:predicted metal-binding protein